MTAIVLVVAIVVILAAVAAWWWYDRRGSGGDRDLRPKRRTARRKVAKLQAQHRAALRQPTKRLQLAEKDHAKAVDQVRKSLAALEDPNGRRLGRYQGVTLYERAIKTPDGTARLTGAKASVDTAGNLAMTQRHTVTRFVAGGALLGPVGALGSVFFPKSKKHDTRELYLSIHTEQFASLIVCKPEEGAKARQFALQINSASSQAPRLEAERPVTIAAAREALEHATANTTAIQACQSELARVQVEPAYIEGINAARAEAAALEPPLRDQRP